MARRVPTEVLLDRLLGKSRSSVKTLARTRKATQDIYNVRHAARLAAQARRKGGSS